MKIDLKKMSRSELEDHLADVTKALEAAKEREKRDARKAIEKVAADHGFSLSELTGAEGSQKRSRKAGKPKYANPANPSQTWTGKGRQPAWYRAEVEKGTAPEKMEI